MLTTEQNSLVEKIAKENGFKDFSILVKDGSKKGDNYLGIIYLITIKEKDGCKEKSLILKAAIKNEQVRTQMPIHDCYKREVYLYDTVLPAFKELQEKHPLPHPFKAYAKLYGYSLADGDEWLLFENITSRGFKMLNRKSTMDRDHVLTVIKEHAKLHSLSFVMKHTDPEQYMKLKENLYDYFRKNFAQVEEAWAEGMKTKYQNAYQAVEGNEKATEGLKRWEQRVKHATEEFQEEKYELVVIHGDSWCNNMMFKYEDQNNPTKPTELCFLDWQISKVTTPAHDLCYFMFLSASKEVLDDHKALLKQYYQILEENLTTVGYNINSVFPYEVFEDHWKAFTQMGLVIAVSMLDILLKEEKDAQTFTDMVEEHSDIIKAFVSQGSSENEERNSRLRDIILMMLENSYL